MAEKYLNNEEIITKKYKPEHVGDFNKLKFALNKIDNIRQQEVGLYSDMFGFAGTVDCVAEFQEVLSVIDFKTSTNNKTADMIEDYFKQCTAYAIAWYERTGEAIEDIVVLISVERGLAPLVYKEKIENWIPGLLADIDRFNQKMNK
jgi:genome maintenance exonuclease 1